MICVVDDSNIIINIINTDEITENNQRIWFPWSCLWEEYTTEKPNSYIEQELKKEKADKINALKLIRNSLEIEPIEWNGNFFDYDTDSRDRLFIARQSIEDNIISSIIWTTAKNTRVEITLEDFIGINKNAAIRSNELHIKYNELKNRIQEATTIEEVDAISWTAVNH